MALLILLCQIFMQAAKAVVHQNTVTSIGAVLS